MKKPRLKPWSLTTTNNLFNTGPISSINSNNPNNNIRRSTTTSGAFSLEHYYSSAFCPLCQKACARPARARGSQACAECRADKTRFGVQIATMRKEVEQEMARIARACHACARVPDENPCACESIDCPCIYARYAVARKAAMLCSLTDMEDFGV